MMSGCEENAIVQAQIAAPVTFKERCDALGPDQGQR